MINRRFEVKTQFIRTWRKWHPGQSLNQADDASQSTADSGVLRTGRCAYSSTISLTNACTSVFFLSLPPCESAGRWSVLRRFATLVWVLIGSFFHLLRIVPSLSDLTRGSSLVYCLRVDFVVLLAFVMVGTWSFNMFPCWQLLFISSGCHKSQTGQ